MALYRASTLSHLLDFKNYSNIKHHNAEILSVFQLLIKRHLCAPVKESTEAEPVKKEKKISTAMKMYLESAKQYEEFLKKEKFEFERGKRHLANMMDLNYEQMTQEDIDESIKYLFPSGLFDKNARPIMKPPEEVFPKLKGAAFDSAGRPYSSMFYTKKQNYNKLLYDIVEEIEKIDAVEHNYNLRGTKPDENDIMSQIGSEWLSKHEIEKKLGEVLKDEEYEYLITTLERLINHPCSNHASEFIMSTRKILKAVRKSFNPIPIETDSNGRKYVIIENCCRRQARGTVKLIANGSGKFIINGHNGLDYFSHFDYREQAIFPLVFVNKINDFDVEVNVRNGGPTGHAGVIRYGISLGLCSFVDEETREKMRIAGLLTKDLRRKERKKPGQEGARRKFTWKKR